MKKLTVLVGLVVALALALPGSANATSISEVKKLTASDAQNFDWFGDSVGISGNIAIVGATGEDTGDTAAGAAYVFERDHGGPDDWGEVRKLTASDAQNFDAFGIRVAISGDTAIVGANGADAGFSNAGAVYVFQRNQGGANNWGEVTKLTAFDAQTNDFFGDSVAISGDTVIVGAGQEDAEAANAGAAYIFGRNQGGQGNWGQVIKLTASDAEAGDAFGFSVAISGNTATVGAIQFSPPGVRAGAAYVFERDQGGPNHWGEVMKLTASDAQSSDFFGTSVAISGDTAVVGAWGADPGGALTSLRRMTRTAIPCRT